MCEGISICEYILSVRLKCILLRLCVCECCVGVSIEGVWIHVCACTICGYKCMYAFGVWVYVCEWYEGMSVSSVRVEYIWEYMWIWAHIWVVWGELYEWKLHMIMCHMRMYVGKVWGEKHVCARGYERKWYKSLCVCEWYECMCVLYVSAIERWICEWCMSMLVVCGNECYGRISVWCTYVEMCIVSGVCMRVVICLYVRDVWMWICKRCVDAGKKDECHECVLLKGGMWCECG